MVYVGSFVIQFFTGYKDLCETIRVDLHLNLTNYLSFTYDWLDTLG